MQLTQILYPDLIFPNLTSAKKIELIHELSGNIHQVVNNIERKEITRSLLEREKLGSTGIGDGVAIPHGRLKGLNNVVGCFARSISGIDFESPDQKKSYLFLVILVPFCEKSEEHVKILSKAARIFKIESVRDDLLRAENRTEIMTALESAEQGLLV